MLTIKVRLPKSVREEMAVYDVYLETGEAGRTLAHVLDLPGCNIAAAGEAEALAILPTVIQAYCVWLEWCGLAAEPATSIELNVVERLSAVGPFHPGDKAALFEWDRQPLSRPELERFLRIAEYSRAELLALARPLPKSVLEWQARPTDFSIARILRHLGNSEEWYVSRLVPPETLPPQWADDDKMSLWPFLAMERKTAVARLRQLTGEELAAVTYPPHHTGHADEAWTARKALRRFVEHSQEHLEQVRHTLADYRAHLLARAAAGRVTLLWPLLGLDETTLTERPVFDHYTAKDILAHIAAWDERERGWVELIAEGRIGEIEKVSLDEFNATTHAARRDWPLEKVVATCQSAREKLLATIAAVPDELLHQRPAKGIYSIRDCLDWRYRHDRPHALQLAKWRKQNNFAAGVGPDSLLLLAAKASRADLEATVTLLTAEERDARPVSDQWTVKDLLGHLADWETYYTEILQNGRAQPFADTIENWNTHHAAIRRAQSWRELWHDFQAGRQALLAAIEQEADLGRRFHNHWGRKVTVYHFVMVLLNHEREHTVELRRLLPGLRLPKELLSCPTPQVFRNLRSFPQN
jgi:uncharacterized damage-inducible protein DinB